MVIFWLLLHFVPVSLQVGPASKELSSDDDLTKALAKTKEVIVVANLEDAVEMGDPRALQQLCARHPYQADALLRLAGYLELAGQLEAASEHAERSASARAR